MSVKKVLKGITYWFVFVIIILIGVVGFYALGDLFIDNADYTRPTDIVQYRIVFPVIGLFMFGFIAGIVCQPIEDSKIWK